MRIIGIDPGLRNVGWAILEKSSKNIINYVSSGKITTNSKEHISSRLAFIHNSLDLILKENSLNFASIEEIFVNNNAKTSLHLGFARGALMTCIAINDIPLKEFAPNYIKKTITGAGKADKQQVQRMINILLPDAKFISEDESDAIAIAYTGIVSNTIS